MSAITAAQCPGGTARVDATPAGSAIAAAAGNVTVQGRTCNSQFVQLDGLFYSTSTYGFSPLALTT
jgi:hypothetical protein